MSEPDLTVDDIARLLAQAITLECLTEDPQARSHWAEREAALRRTLAALFARERGWRLARNPFSIRALRGRTVASNVYACADDTPGWAPARVMPEPTWFRDASCRAAAIAAHPHRSSLDRAALERWAADNDLAATFPDFPSWRWPGECVLVLFEPAIAVVPLGVPVAQRAMR